MSLWVGHDGVYSEGVQEGRYWIVLAILTTQIGLPHGYKMGTLQEIQ
jgi:hypothetical protein